MAKKHSVTLLNAAAAVVNGTGVAVENYRDFTVFIEASGGANATVQIQAKAPSGNWIAIDSRAIAADGNTVVQFAGALKEIRAAITARTAGTFTVTMDAMKEA